MQDLPLDYLKYFKDINVSAENKDIVDYCNRKYWQIINKQNDKKRNANINQNKNSEMEATIKGIIKKVGETQSFGSSGFQKRDLVVTTDGDYPQDMLIEFHQDNTEKLDSYKVGESISVAVNLRGKEWINPKTEVVRYFVSLVGWRIDEVASDKPKVEKIAESEFPTDDSDDLPF